MSKSPTTNESYFLSRLQELEQETDLEFVFELIDLYCDESPKMIHSIATALQSQNAQALAIAAHTLKGSSLNIGAKQMGTLCLHLEELGKSKGPIPLDTSTREIEAEFERIKLTLMTYKRSRS
jgi:histidine-containing phosphotransfer protein